MSRLHSDVKNLGQSTASLPPGYKLLLEHFATTNRPVIGITSTSQVVTGVLVNDYATLLDEASPNYGKLHQWNGTSWVIVTPATLSVTTDHLVANAVTAAKLAATAIDGQIITGAYIRTAASGGRVTMDGTNGVCAYNSSGNLRSQISLDGELHGITLTPPAAGSFSGAMVISTDWATSLALSLITDTTKVELYPAGSRIEFTVSNLKAKIDSTGLVLSNCSTGITLPAGATVDGVDISAHDASATVHGVTGSVMGTNMTNTLGASGIIDAQTNSAKICTRLGPSFANAASPPTMTDGETLVCDCSGNSLTYFVHRSGANYAYSEAYWNALPPVLH